MLPRWLLRAFVTLATVTVVWLVAGTARASTGSVAPAVAGSSSPLGMSVAAPGGPLASLLPATPPESPPMSGAPLCDPRGMIRLAPPPQLQDSEVSLDDESGAAALGDACSEAIAPGRHTLQRSSGGAEFASSSVEPLAHPGAPLLSVTRRFERAKAPDGVTWPVAPGFATGIERPPRR